MFNPNLLLHGLSSWSLKARPIALPSYALHRRASDVQNLVVKLQRIS